ncbi:MAG: DUF3310 domain-containing protein [Mesorhizobium sp.]|nr:MAG: DUF3310 domain-containing protein [Mesorhizobium sp.]
MSNLRRDLMFQVFLHVNRELTDFQRAMLKKIVGPDATPETIRDAVVRIGQQIKLLSDAGWKPNREPGDQVLKPNHYDRLPMEPTYFLVESGGYHWCIENAFKYLCRFPWKNGIEDLGKSSRNLLMYQAYVAGDPSWSR